MKMNIRKIFAIFLTAMLIPGAAVIAEDTVTTQQGPVVVVVTPADNISLWGSGIGYPRVLELQHNGNANGTLLATCEYYNSGLGGAVGYPIYRSTDHGNTWTYVTKVFSTMKVGTATVQSEYQPFLYELPRKTGDMPAGTLLLASCLVDAPHAQASAIVIYRSMDQGETWEMYSTVATGGSVNAPSSGVWEPFLMMLDNGTLVCYYSDSTEREEHSQGLTYRTSSDGVTWSTPVMFVALEDRTLRPGMSTVCRLSDGRYFMTYEMCDEDNSNVGNKVTFRYSADGLDWGNPEDPGTVLTTTDGKTPGSAPYNAFVPGFGEKGVLVVTGCFQTPGAPSTIGTYLYVSLDLGTTWKKWRQPLPYVSGKGGYSSCMFLSSDQKTLYMTNCNLNPDSTKGYYKFDFTTLVFGEAASESVASSSQASSQSLADQSSAAASVTQPPAGSTQSLSESSSDSISISSAASDMASQDSDFGSAAESQSASGGSGGKQGSTLWIWILAAVLAAGGGAAAWVVLRKRKAAGK